MLLRDTGLLQSEGRNNQCIAMSKCKYVYLDEHDGMLVTINTKCSGVCVCICMYAKAFVSPRHAQLRRCVCVCMSFIGSREFLSLLLVTAPCALYSIYALVCVRIVCVCML